MRVKTFFRMLRIIAAVTLFFFSWSFGPIYAAVAYAAAPEGQGAAKTRNSELGVRNVTPQSGERFEKALEDIRANVTRTEEKTAKGEDTSKEIAALKAKKANIESIDAELKVEFAKTEKRLRDAKLPAEILNRHYKFVKHYEDHFSQLKTEVSDIETAKTGKERNARIQAIKEHLDAVKPARKHVPLDPNKLPNRTVKAKERKPRLKKEDFEKDFPLQKRTTKLASLRAISIANGREWARIASTSTPLLASHSTPALLAYNDVASDVPFSLGVRPLNQQSEIRNSRWNVPQLAVAESAPLLLAQAVNLPTADDLAETPEIQFTPDIQTLASQLNNNPVNIYNWVRNNIEYAPTYGSIQGADQCRQSKICNDMDTASLLIALLRVSGIYSHYVYGTIQMPIDKAMNWVGGVTDPNMAGTVLATNGVPATALFSGGTIKYEQVEHVWVKAYIDYIPSRGAVQRQGNTWIPLDASYKQYNYTQGINIASAVPFDAQSFANQILSSATTNTTDGSVTNVNSAIVQQTMEDYQTQVQNYITQNFPNATVGDVIGKKDIVQQNYPILLGTLPYKTVQVGSEFATVPANLRETMSFSIPDPTGTSAGLTYTTGMPQIAGKKITLSFSPANTSDQVVIESYLPTPHPDGTPILPNELPSSLPAYLINLKPELRISGQVVATGSPVTMGSALSFTMSLNEPALGLSNIDNIIQSGEYYGIGLDTGRIGDSTRSAIGSKLAATKAKLDAKNYAGLTEDDLIGDLLFNTITTYFAELDTTDEISSMTMGVVRYRAPSVGMFSLVANVQEVFGVPVSISSKGMMMDVNRIMQAVFSKDGNQDSVKQYMLISGSTSSAKEHSVPEYLFSTANKTVHGISAVKAMQVANSQGIPIYTINGSNINTILPQLQVDSTLKTDIQNAVNAGKVVTIPRTNVVYNGWSICGYMIIDPATGSGAYMISGGASGALLEALGSIISNFLVSDAEASVLEDTYITQAPVPVIQPPCYSYVHNNEWRGCVTLVLTSTNFIKGILAVLGASFGVMLLVSQVAGVIICILAAVALLSTVILSCRQTATHCDPGH